MSGCPTFHESHDTDHTTFVLQSLAYCGKSFESIDVRSEWESSESKIESKAVIKSTPCMLKKFLVLGCAGRRRDVYLILHLDYECRY